MVLELKKVEELSLDQIKNSIFDHLDQLDKDFQSIEKEIEEYRSKGGGNLDTNDMANRKIYIKLQREYLEEILEFIDTDFSTLTDTARSDILIELKKISEIDVARESQRVKMREMNQIKKSIDGIARMELSLLKDSLWNTNVDDLVSNSLSFDSVNRGSRLNDADINDIFAAAYLGIKDANWRNNFDLGNFKKDGIYSLDISRDDFYKVLEKACSKMDFGTLYYFLDGGITVNLNGKQEIFNSEGYSRQLQPDRKYEHIIKMEINRREGRDQKRELQEDIKLVSYIPVAKEEVIEGEVIETKEPEIKKEPEVVREVVEVSKKQIIKEAADFIFTFEGFTEKPYWDKKQWSWGYGTKVPGSTNNKNKNPGGTITKEEAKIAKYSHIEADYQKVSQYFWFDPMTKNQKIAILSFVYNNGRGIFEVATGARRLQEVFFDPQSTIDDKIKAMVRFHYASGVPLEGLKRRRSNEAMLMRNGAQQREQIDMMVMNDNETPGETTSVIYGKDTLGRTITRAIDRINKSTSESDSSTLATRLAKFNPDFNTIHSGDRVYTKKKQFDNINYYEVTFKQYRFLVKGNNVYSIDTPLDQVIKTEYTEIKEVQEQPNYVVQDKDTLGKILEQLFPNIYNESNPGWKTTMDYIPNPGDNIFVNGTTLKVKRGNEEFLFEVN